MNSRYTFIIILILLALISAGCSKEKQRRLDTAKKALGQLSKGNQKVERYIAWEVFRFLGEDIGSQYQQATSNMERNGFKRMTIARLAVQCRGEGWAPDKFTNWQMNYTNKGFASIYVDAPKGKLMITMMIEDTTRRITAIDRR